MFIMFKHKTHNCQLSFIALRFRKNKVEMDRVIIFNILCWNEFSEFHMKLAWLGKIYPKATGRPIFGHPG